MHDGHFYRDLKFTGPLIGFCFATTAAFVETPKAEGAKFELVC
jgi:hypothetical protein